MNRVVQQFRTQARGSDPRQATTPRPVASRLVAERRQRIVLSCAACGGRNYRTTKARREGTGQLQLSKFCSICNAHTVHREAV